MNDAQKLGWKGKLNLFQFDHRDSSGDFISRETAVAAVEKVKLPLMIFHEYQHTHEHYLGRLNTLTIEGDQVVAEVKLTQRGAELIDNGFELGMYGVIRKKTAGIDGDQIDEFELKGASLVAEKVK